MTILIRDRALEDKVVEVIEPLDTVKLTYDQVNGEEDLRLVFVKTDWPNYSGVEVSQIHKLYFGDYLNSEDQTITVLHKVRQSTDIGRKVLEDVKVIRNCKQCPVYEVLDDEITQLIQKRLDNQIQDDNTDTSTEGGTSS